VSVEIKKKWIVLVCFSLTITKYLRQAILSKEKRPIWLTILKVKSLNDMVIGFGEVPACLCHLMVSGKRDYIWEKKTALPNRKTERGWGHKIPSKCTHQIDLRISY
jgi:hypothetical protein